MKITQPSNSSPILHYIGLFSTVILLVWIGIFKFTPSEASAIKPLIENHPLTFWMYDVFSVQTVSNIVGITELFVASLLLLTLKFNFLKTYAGIGVVTIFTVTITYLFTTPNTWRVIDGVPITDFFILKDLLYLGYGISLIVSSKK